MSQPAKWWPDPYGRFQQRYFDGSNWTAHVINSGGEQTIDPLGTTVAVPFSTPTSSPMADASAVTPTTPAGTASSLRGFLDGLGPETRTRPSVHLSIALAGAGGAAAASGLAVAIIGDSNSSKPRNVVAAATVVVIAYVLRLGVKSQPEMRSAAVGAAAVGIPGLAAATTNVGDGGGTLVLAAVLLIAAWALPGMRGRPLLLGAGAVALVLALTTFGNNTADGTEVFDLGPADVIGGEAWLFVIVAVAFLAMVWWLDENGFHGVGTSLVVAAILATAFGVLKVVQDLGSTGAALLLAAAGLAVAVVGDHGQRRATTWFGVAVAAVATIAAFFSALEPSSTGGTASTLIFSGLALAAVPALWKAIRASRTPQPD